MEYDGDNILDAIYDEENFDDDHDDVDMIDVEEGELVEPHTENVSGKSKNSAGGGGDINEGNQVPPSKNSKRRANKKKNKRKRNASGSKPVDVNRFVLDTCRRLKEKKSYMVYTAVGCLGISALSEIVNEVDAIQACGGQKTADGRRFRTGGGILWSILKVREPKAYKEIMKKAKEFEKQFRQPNAKQLPVPKKEESSQGVPFSFAGRDPKEESSQVVAFSFAGKDPGNDSDSAFPAVQMQNQPEPATSKENPVSIHDRLRIPVSYDDDLLVGSQVNDATDWP